MEMAPVVQLLIVIIGALIGALQAVIIMMFQGLKAKMVEYCQNNKLDHDQLWYQLDHHKHTPEGEVVIK